MDTAEQIEVLVKAKEITEDRWVTGRLGEGDPAAPCCINGALMQARGLAPEYEEYESPEHIALCLLLCDTIGLDGVSPQTGDKAAPYALEAWNDRFADDSAPLSTTARKENTAVVAALQDTIDRLSRS